MCSEANKKKKIQGTQTSGLSVALANAGSRLFLFKDTSEMTAYSWGQHMNVLEASAMNKLWDAGQKIPITVDTGSDKF